MPEPGLLVEDGQMHEWMDRSLCNLTKAGQFFYEYVKLQCPDVTEML